MATGTHDMRHGRRRVKARGSLPQPPSVVHGFLADAANHHRLTGPGVALVGADGHGDTISGTLVLTGPLRIRRTAISRVTTSVEPTVLSGVARLGRSSTANIRWELHERDGGTTVELTVELTALSRPDRVLLALGARRWIGRLLGDTLARLSGALSAADRASLEPSHASA
jgi:hypothetical protein